MKIKDLLKGAEVISWNGCEELEVTGVTGNSEMVTAGNAFVCINGVKFDGHDFIGAVAEKGAAVAITERVPEDPALPFVLVDNTRLAASYIFANANGNPERAMKIVGVTGTNGKTSTAYMLRHIFEDAGFRCGIIGTILNAWGDKVYESEMTTPDPEHLYALLGRMRDDNTEYVFMEVSSHSLALGRVAPISFEAAVYTNLTQEHLDFHKTMENYAAAKEILFGKTKLGIFNADNEYSRASAGKGLCKSVTFSAEGREDADYTARSIDCKSVEGISYEIYGKNEKEVICKVDSVIPGLISVYNTMGAVLCAIMLGIPPEMVRRGIYELLGVPGRLEKATPRNCPFTAVIDYAHTPDALSNVAGILISTKRKDQKLTILFGCGGDRDKTKRPVMGEIASRLADFTIITSDNCRTEDPDRIITDILAGVHKDSNYTVIPDRREAIAFAVSHAVPGEVILIAGKGHENYEIKKDGKHPFSEKDEVAGALARRFGK